MYMEYVRGLLVHTGDMHTHRENETIRCHSLSQARAIQGSATSDRYCNAKLTNPITSQLCISSYNPKLAVKHAPASIGIRVAADVGWLCGCFTLK